MSKRMNEETRTLCPRCRADTVAPGHDVCDACAGKKPGERDEKPGRIKNEMGGGGVAGFQLPLGVSSRKEKIREALGESGDLNEAHALVFFRNAPPELHETFFEAIDLFQYDVAASLIREHVVRESVRRKIAEIVRKKAGGGGFVLYAPNKGKKHGAKAVGQFPTKLAAKRAELARFPPKDPRKLGRLRKEVEKLMKDPKKRAEAELKAMRQKGTDIGHHAAGHARGKKFGESVSHDMVERALLSAAAVRSLHEGLFREEAPPSQWDDFIGKVSDRVIKGDRGYQRIQKRLEMATSDAMARALKIIQRQLGGEARVKAAARPGTTENGQTYVPFTISIEAAEVGPMFLYVEKGRPAIEMSDEAKNSLTKVTPGAAKAIRAALATSGDSLNEVDSVSSVVGQRDQYLGRLEQQIDRMIAGMSPLQVSLLKQLLVKKYRSISK
jgi:hypothetical protein